MASGGAPPGLAEDSGYRRPGVHGLQSSVGASSSSKGPSKGPEKGSGKGGPQSTRTWRSGEPSGYDTGGKGHKGGGKRGAPPNWQSLDYDENPSPTQRSPGAREPTRPAHSPPPGLERQVLPPPPPPPQRSPGAQYTQQLAQQAQQAMQQQHQDRQQEQLLQQQARQQQQLQMQLQQMQLQQMRQQQAMQRHQEQLEQQRQMMQQIQRQQEQLSNVNNGTAAGAHLYSSRAAAAALQRFQGLVSDRGPATAKAGQAPPRFPMGGYGSAPDPQLEQRRAEAEARAAATAQRLQASGAAQVLAARVGGQQGGTAEASLPLSAQAPAESTRPTSGAPRYLGRVKAFNQLQGFGFIHCDEMYLKHRCDVFLNQAVEGGVIIGSTVSFSVEISKAGKPQAREIVLEKDALPRPPPTAPREGRNSPGAAAVALIGSVFCGRVKSFNAARGFGFLICQELDPYFEGRDVYISRSEAPDGRLAVGQEVEFILGIDREGHPQGRSLKLLPPSVRLAAVEGPQ